MYSSFTRAGEDIAKVCVADFVSMDLPPSFR